MLKYLLGSLLLTAGLIAGDDCCETDCCPPPAPACPTSCEPECCPDPCCDPCCRDVLLEFRAAYFHPTGSRFDDIYGGSGIYNLELSVQTWCDLYTWLSVGYLRETGRTKELKTKTTFQMVPLGIGFKYLFSCGCFNPYLGAGLGVTWMDVDNKTSFAHDVDDWGVGGVFKIGSLWNFCDCWFLDLFIDYTYMCLGFSGTKSDPFVFRNDADISGFSFGAGIGYRF